MQGTCGLNRLNAGNDLGTGWNLPKLAPVLRKKSQVAWAHHKPLNLGIFSVEGHPHTFCCLFNFTHPSFSFELVHRC